MHAKLLDYSLGLKGRAVTTRCWSSSVAGGNCKNHSHRTGCLTLPVERYSRESLQVLYAPAFRSPELENKVQKNLCPSAARQALYRPVIIFIADPRRIIYTRAFLRGI